MITVPTQLSWFSQREREGIDSLPFVRSHFMDSHCFSVMIFEALLHSFDGKLSVIHFDADVPGNSSKAQK